MIVADVVAARHRTPSTRHLRASRRVPSPCVWTRRHRSLGLVAPSRRPGGGSALSARRTSADARAARARAAAEDAAAHRSAPLADDDTVPALVLERALWATGAKEAAMHASVLRAQTTNAASPSCARGATRAQPSTRRLRRRTRRARRGGAGARAAAAAEVGGGGDEERREGGPRVGGERAGGGVPPRDHAGGPARQARACTKPWWWPRAARASWGG